MFLTDLYKWLQANTSLGTDEIFPEVLEDSFEGSAITYTLESETEEESTDGFVSGACEAKVLLAIWDKDYGDMLSTMKSLRDDLHSMRGVSLVAGQTKVSHAIIKDQSSDYEPVTGFYVYAMLVQFTYTYV